MVSHRILKALLGLLGLLSVLCCCVATWLWRYAHDEWRVPVRIGHIEINVSAPAGLRLLTQPTIARLLDGYRFNTPIGTVVTHWDAISKVQHIHCAPCRIPARSFGSESISLAALDVSIKRQNSNLRGHISAGDIAGNWHGELTQSGLKLVVDMPLTPVSALYELFHADIPELAVAQIHGYFDAHLERSFPASTWEIKTHIDLTSVAGLGTEVLRGIRPVPSCAMGGSQPPGRHSKIALAVIAAEDQRFWEHRGYDARELAAALDANARRGDVIRGASTINQQLAKLLYVGPERSPVRKLRELLYAVEMDRTLGKAQILALYLAIAPWGASQCGAEAAAQHYLAKPANKLNVQEAAWLAALLRNPSASLRNEELTRQHARWIVGGMTGIPNSQRRQAELALTAARF